MHILIQNYDYKFIFRSGDLQKKNRTCWRLLILRPYIQKRSVYQPSFFGIELQKFLIIKAVYPMLKLRGNATERRSATFFSKTSAFRYFSQKFSLSFFHLFLKINERSLTSKFYNLRSGSIPIIYFPRDYFSVVKIDTPLQFRFAPSSLGMFSWVHRWPVKTNCTTITYTV